MAVMKDVAKVTVLREGSKVTSLPVTRLVVSSEWSVQNVTVKTADTKVVRVVTQGPQGPAGLQNVFVSATDPSKDKDGNLIWGPEQENFVWIRI